MKGISSLALCHPKYPVSNLIRVYRTSTSPVAVRWLHTFFNPKNSDNAKKLLTKVGEKVGLVSVHIINGPGMNNNRVQPHEITRGFTHGSLERAIQNSDRNFMRLFRDQVTQVLKVVRDSGCTAPLYICPWLERQEIAKSTYLSLANIVKDVIPTARLIDNALSGPNYGEFSETHGESGRPGDIYDLDGTDWQTIDLETWTKHRMSNICYLWGLVENGNEKGEAGKPAPWLPPEKRTNFPTEREFKFYQFWLNDDLGALPPIDLLDSKDLKLQATNDGAKKGFTWKLGDGRKVGTALFPSKFQPFKKVTITHGGKRIDVGTYSGKYTHDGSNRLIYRFTKHPVELPEMSVIRTDNLGWLLERPGYRID